MVNACMVIAHPDDDAIFGSAFEYINKKWDWTIITCSATKDRFEELQNFQEALLDKPVKCINLDFTDNPQDFESKVSTWNERKLAEKISDCLIHGMYDVVLSHNENGEYGHPHHKQVGKVVENFLRFEEDITFYTFGYGIKNADIIIHTESKAELIRKHYKSQSWVSDSFDSVIQTYCCKE